MGVCFKLKVEDMDGFVELLVQVQPRRLLLANALSQHTLSILANSLKSNLEVEAMHLPATKDGLGDISKLLQRCPCLRNCRLSNGGLNAPDVAGLRAEVAGDCNLIELCIMESEVGEFIAITYCA